jgi:DNA-binding sugar fermentation-stimulating protein
MLISQQITMKTKMEVFNIDGLVPATVLKRPSALIKTPYVSDIQLHNDIEPHLGHSLSLGCCGLCDKGSTVYVSPIYNAKSGVHCDYTVQLSTTQSNTIIGINPRLAEHIVENCIIHKYILPEISTYKREYTVDKDILGSNNQVRFDFGGTTDDNTPFYLEVKSVPLATENGIAYFPEGYRKKPGDSVSPRALKHIKELMHIKLTTRSRCIICYVIQRNDVTRFEISKSDPEYRAAVLEAIDAGVEAFALVVEWTATGQARYIKQLNVT